MNKDISNEKANYVGTGMQHKYSPTLLVMSSEQCVSVCEWCFRGRIFEGKKLEDDKVADATEVIEYVKTHPEVKNILFTGGDSFLADREYLKKIVLGVNDVKHLVSIRFGTRAMVLEPSRYNEMKEIFDLSKKPVYIVLHIVKPEEITQELVDITSNAYHMFLSQVPLMKTVNDKPERIRGIFRKMSEGQIDPYYVFQCRAVEGNEVYALTFKEAYEILEDAKKELSGVNKRFRYVMSCDAGKLEIVGIDGDKAYLRYHQARDPENFGKLITAPANAVWLVEGKPLFLKDNKFVH
jgi:lysine 2,3-aminomutase